MTYLSKALGRLRGLSAQLLLLIILPLTLLLIAVAFAGVNLHQRDMRELVGERDRRAVTITATALSAQMENRFNRLRALADRAVAETPEHVLLASDYLLTDFDAGVALYDVAGRVLAATPAAAGWQATSAAQTWLDAARRSGKPAVLPLSAGIIPMAASSGDGQVMALGAFTVEGLRTWLAPALMNGHNRMTLLLSDPQGRLLAALGPSPAQSSLATYPGVAEALRGESGVSFVMVQGEERVIAFAPVPSTGWALVAEEAWADVVSPQMRLSQAAPLVLLPAMLIALVALAFAWGRVVRPLQTLRERAAQLGQGDWQSIEQPVGGIEEVVALQRTLAHMAQQVRRAREALEGYIADITAAQEEERKRLARELHDQTIQSLVALNQRVQMARRALAHDPARADEKLAELQALLMETVAEVRRFSQALRPIYLEELGLVPALEMLARDSQAGTAMQVTFETVGTLRRLPPAAELAIYRIVQEALNNAARHAQARAAHVRVAFDGPGLLVQVSDDGVGFVVPEQVSELAARGHFGLMGMHERAQLIGAHLAVRSQPAQGTTVEIRYVPPPNGGE